MCHKTAKSARTISACCCAQAGRRAFARILPCVCGLRGGTSPQILAHYPRKCGLRCGVSTQILAHYPAFVDLTCAFNHKQARRSEKRFFLYSVVQKITKFRRKAIITLQPRKETIETISGKCSIKAQTQLQTPGILRQMCHKTANTATNAGETPENVL